MRLANHSNTLETNQTGETKSFGIGNASVVIDILRNRLYEHKIRTLVQEYICNARDAMREVGKGNEFEVAMPNRLSPVFKVRDFGPGISPDRMSNVFVNYGSSTKRGTNNQTGGFGIGAKSAWSYTDSFTITTHIDGVKRVYVAHTGVDNNGRLDHVSTGPTTEENGTEIQVPVQTNDIQEFRTSIFRAIYFWEVQPKLRGEVEAAPQHSGGFKLSDTIEFANSRMISDFIGLGSYADKAAAIIDGVVYPISRSLYGKCPSLQTLTNLLEGNQRVLLHFGNGVVEVSASRESIADSKTSVEALEKMGKAAVVKTKAHIKAQFDKVTSTTEFFKTYLEVRENFNTSGFAKYGDYAIDGNGVESDLLNKVTLTVVTNEGRYGRKGEKIHKNEMRYNSEIPLNLLKNLYYKNKEETLVKMNKRYRDYLTGNRTKLILIEPKLAVVTAAVSDKEGKITTPAVMAPDMVSFQQLITDLSAVDVLTLTWVDTPKANNRADRVKLEKTEFCAHTPSSSTGRHTYVKADETETDWLFLTMKENAWPDGYTAELVRQLSDYTIEVYEKQVCGISETAAKKVVGNARFASLKEFLAKWKPSKEEMNYAKFMQAGSAEIMKLLIDIKSLDDDFLSSMIKEYKAIGRIDKKARELRVVPEMLVTLIKATDAFKEFAANDEKLEKLLEEKYPLLSTINDYQVEKVKSEIQVYLNAKHKAA